MNHMLSFKFKVLVCGLLAVALFATGMILFAMKQESDTNGASVDSGKKASKEKPIVVLGEGKDQQVVSLPDFLKLLSVSPSVSVDKPEQANAQLLDLIRLQNQVEMGKKQIELLEKMIKQTEKKSEKKDSWWQEGMKTGFKNYKEILANVGKYLAEKMTSFTVNGALLIGSAWVAYKIIWPPIYCHTPLPSIFYGLSSPWILGSKIPESWYSETGICSSSYPEKDALTTNCDLELIQKYGGLVPRECVR